MRRTPIDDRFQIRENALAVRKRTAQVIRIKPSRIQKISIDAGFSCPNRDGTLGTRGCVYCNNDSFRPNRQNPVDSIRTQIERAISFFEKKYPDQKYMAYFQNYSNTHAEVSVLEGFYRAALADERVVGIAVATRPDCMDDSKWELLRHLQKSHSVLLEFGVESTCDATLKEMNRGHTWADSVNAIARCAEYGIPCGGHLILGFPGESRDVLLGHADALSKLPISSLKIHHLQVIRGTELAERWLKQPFPLMSVEEYLELALEFKARLDPRIRIERWIADAPKELVLAPDWGDLKNYQFVPLLNNREKKSKIF